MERRVGKKIKVGKKEEIIDGKISQKNRIIKKERGTTTPCPGIRKAKAFYFKEKSNGKRKQRKINGTESIDQGYWQKKWIIAKYSLNKTQRRRIETINRPKVYEAEQKGEEYWG